MTEKERRRRTPTLRTPVYTIAVMIQTLWIIFLIVEIGWILKWNLSASQSLGSPEIYSVLYFVIKKMLLIILPLSSFLPPIFKKSKTRKRVNLVLDVLGILGLGLLFLSNMTWLGFVPQPDWLYQLHETMTDAGSSLVMTSALVFSTVLRLMSSKHYTSDPLKTYQNKLAVIEGSLLLSIAGSANFISSSSHVTFDIVQEIHQHLYPYALIAWFIIVEIRQYVKFHMDYYTVKQAIYRSTEFLRRYSLSPNEKMLIEETSVTRYLLELAVERPLYPLINCNNRAVRGRLN